MRKYINLRTRTTSENKKLNIGIDDGTQLSFD